jgi:hypothetical protein
MFTPTKWSTAQDKQKFRDSLIKFIQSDFNENKFTKKLYTRLSVCFGHIAHTSQSGFYYTWFSTKTQQDKWINHIKRASAIGDPEWTYSDVEKEIKKFVADNY